MSLTAIYSKARGSSASTLGACPPVWTLLRFYFWKCWQHNTHNFIVINKQCLQCAFYSLLSLQKHRVCVKGHQINLQTSKIIPRWDCAPCKKIPGSVYATCQFNIWQVNIMIWQVDIITKKSFFQTIMSTCQMCQLVR